MMSTVKGKGKAKDDDEVVSLGSTEDEGLFGDGDDAEMEEVHPSLDFDGNNDLGTTEYDVDHEISSSTGLELFLRQVRLTQSDETIVNSNSQLDSIIATAS